MKKVLIASYYFPPYSHPGVQRPLKFAKYLPLFGYQPVVAVCANVPWRDFDHEIYNKDVKGKMIVSRIEAPNYSAIDQPLSLKTFMPKTILKLQSILIEDRLDWAFGQKKQFVALSQDHNISLVLTTGPPHSVHYIGAVLKSRLKLPWIADFRDPMAEHPLQTGQSMIAFIANKIKRKTLISFFEHAIVKQCDALITTTESITEYFKNRYVRYKNKIFTITNGFDESDFNGIQPKKLYTERLNLVYTGRFWIHEPDAFLSGLKCAIQRETALKSKLSVIIIGPHDENFENKITMLGLGGIISTLGTMNHREAISYQLGSDANLLILSTSVKHEKSPIIAAKTFEYLRAGRPILAVVPDGPARVLLEETKFGYLSRPGNPEDVALMIIKLYRDWKDGTLKKFNPQMGFIRRFERKELTQKLAGIFDECLRQDKF